MTLESLSPLQRSMLEDLLAGKSRKQIEIDRGITSASVSTCIARVKRKLGLRSDVEIGIWGQRNGLVPERTA